ncbi:MAG: hypothetical protein K0B08_12450, partial [Bacteroidales bacterium]|nr:hypothetical protein [Bacteroidales bacterium]
MRTPSFQHLAAKIASGFLSKELNTPIYINKLRISGMLDVRLGGVKLLDIKGQPMLELGVLHVKTEKISLKDHRIDFKFIRLVDGGFFLRKYENDSLLNLNYFLKNFEGAEPDSIPAPVWKLSCKSLILDDLAFGFRDEHKDRVPEGMDFSDIFISEIFINLWDIAVDGDSISAIVGHLSCVDKSGLSVQHFSGKSQVSSSGIRVEKLNLETGQTSLDMDLAFLYDGYNNLGYFLDSVFIIADIRSSLLTLSDIGYFAPVLVPMTDPVMFEARVDGTVSDFAASDLNIKTGNHTEFSGDISLKGLPDVNNTFTSLDIKKLTTTPEDVIKFHLPLEKQLTRFPDPVNELGITTIKGKIAGFPDEFRARLDISSDMGKLSVSGKYFGRDPLELATYFGEVTGTEIRLDKITGNHDLGTVDVDLEYQGRGVDNENLNVILSGWIENLLYKGYRYDKIILGGEINARSYYGRLLVMDPALSLSFDGLVDFNQEIPEIDFSLELLRARFFDMNLSDKSEDMNLQGKITADFTGIDPDHFNGMIRIDSMIYTEHGKEYFLQHLELNRVMGPDVMDQITLRSDYIDADLTGTFKIQDLIDQVMYFLVGSGEDPLAEMARIENPQHLLADLRLKDISPFTEIFIPELEVTPGAVVKGEFDSYRQILTIEGNAEMITFGGIQFSEVGFSGETINRQFHFDGNAGRIVLLEQKDKVGLSLDHFNVNAIAGTDSITFSLLWDNYDNVLTNQATIDGFIRFP